MSISSIQSNYASYGIFSMTNSRNRLFETSGNRNSGPDTVHISEEARKLAEEATPAQTESAETVIPDNISLSDVDSAVESGRLLHIEMRDKWGRLVSEPSIENMQHLTNELETRLRKLFQQAGISMNPPVKLSVVNGKVQANGARSDLDAINELTGSDKELADTIEKLAYVMEEMSSFVQQGHLEFSRAYQASSNPDVVIQRYSHLFGQKVAPSSCTITFGGSVSTSWGGKTVSANDFINNPAWIE